jgi:hypothetical protein
VRTGRAVAATAALVLSACGGGSGQDAAKSLSSLAAGASLVAGLRVRGAVPAVYARRLADDLRGEAAKEAQALRKPDAGPGAAGALRASARLDAVLAQLRRAMDGDDRAALRRCGVAADSLSKALTAAAARRKGGAGG